MYTKLLLGAALALMVVVLGAAVVTRAPSRYAASKAPSVSTSSAAAEQVVPARKESGAASSSSASASGYTMADVTKHSSAQSCWTAINGSVYDVTSWISQHPGGADAILSLCGIDGSAAFNEQHGGQRRPADELAGFKIGALLQ